MWNNTCNWPPNIELTREIRIILDNPWFKGYRRRNFYFAFFMNYCIYRVFRDKYMNKSVGLDTFMDAMHSTMSNVFCVDVEYTAAYDAARLLFRNEKELEEFIIDRVLYNVKMLYSVDEIQDWRIVAYTASIFEDMIRQSNKIDYSYCLGKIQARRLADFYDDK